MTELTKTSSRRAGLKARIELLLAERHTEALTLAQIGLALDIPKTEHASISATLIKIRDAGRIRTTIGPAGSSKGRRYVKLYRYNPKRPTEVVQVPEMDKRLALAFSR